MQRASKASEQELGEQELGYDIFIRRPSKPLVLTPTGAESVRSAQHFVDHAEVFYEESVGLGTQLKGTIRLGCFAAFSSLLPPPIMRHCQESLPMLTLQIFEYDLPEMLARLRTGDVEIAITRSSSCGPTTGAMGERR